jgi:hypothetical protein
MNVERMIAVRDAILEKPERLEMATVHRRRGWRVQHCIFGMVQVMYSPHWRDRVFGGYFAAYRDDSILMALVDLDYSEGMELFHRAFWPEGLRKQYELGTQIGSSTIRALAAAEAINQFIDKHTYLKPVNAA